MLVCGVLAALVLAPFLWAVATGGAGAPNRPDLGFTDIAVEVLRLPVGILSPPAAPVAAALWLGAAAIGLVLGWRRGGRARTGAVLAAGWLLLPPVLLCLLQATTSAPGLLARYWTFCLPALALSVGLAVGLAVETGGRRLGLLAIIGVAVIAVVGLPTQLVLRGPDGHAGQGWRALPSLLQDPAVRAGAVLVEGPHYRALVANQPGVTARMPLVIDPGPTGRILPRLAGRDSVEFRELADRYRLAVVLQNLPRPSTTEPTRRSFVDHRRELAAYDRAPVLCSYFGYPLGVFTTSAGRLNEAQARRIADALTAVDPTEVTCTAR